MKTYSKEQRNNLFLYMEKCKITLEKYEMKTKRKKTFNSMHRKKIKHNRCCIFTDNAVDFPDLDEKPTGKLIIVKSNYRYFFKHPKDPFGSKSFVVEV